MDLRLSLTRRTLRNLAAGGLMLAVSGCGSSTLLESLPSWPGLPSLPDWPRLSSLSPFPPAECATVSAKAVKRVDWSRVPEVDMRVRNNEFEPMIVNLKQGWPYVFRIRNRDDYDHIFHSRDFFQNMAIIRMTVDGERQEETCIRKIAVPAGGAVEMRLVAAVDGHYEFEDKWLPTPLVFSTGAAGVVIVEERTKTEYR